jgi:protein-disulfide isomerase
VAIVVVGVLIVGSGVLDRDESRQIAIPDRTVPPGLADGRALGAADAPITIEVWEDFQCPVCGVFARNSEPRLIEEYVIPGKVRLVYRDMAFLGQESLDAAVAARAAERDSGLFWQYHDLLYQNQDGENEGAFNRTVLGDMAVSLGLDRATFLAALDDRELIDAVRAETAEGQRAGINSTPTLDINGQRVVGLPNYDRLADALDEMLASASPGAVEPSPGADQ